MARYLKMEVKENERYIVVTTVKSIIIYYFGRGMTISARARERAHSYGRYNTFFYAISNPIPGLDAPSRSLPCCPVQRALGSALQHFLIFHPAL